MFFSKINRLIITITPIIVLTACASTATPMAEQTSLPVPRTPLQKTPTTAPTTTPTATPMSPTCTPTPTPKPSLEDILLTDAHHIQGVDTAPVTLIEFSDFK